jgi:DnaJ-class molecular chaperone
MMRSLANPTAGPTCRACEGTGRVPHPWQSPFRLGLRRDRTCADCGGSGYDVVLTKPATGTPSAP